MRETNDSFFFYLFFSPNHCHDVKICKIEQRSPSGWTDITVSGKVGCEDETETSVDEDVAEEDDDDEDDEDDRTVPVETELSTLGDTTVVLLTADTMLPLRM